MAIRVNMNGLKEVLGLWIAQTEGAKFWPLNWDIRQVLVARTDRNLFAILPIVVLKASDLERLSDASAVHLLFGLVRITKLLPSRMAPFSFQSTIQTSRTIPAASLCRPVCQKNQRAPRRLDSVAGRRWRSRDCKNGGCVVITAHPEQMSREIHGTKSRSN